jgi:hypothetical protein
MEPQCAVDEAAWKAEFSSERARAMGIIVIFAADAACIVVSNLLLSLRHPQNNGPSFEMCLDYVRGMIGKLREQGFSILAEQCEYDLDCTLRIRGVYGT